MKFSGYFSKDLFHEYLNQYVTKNYKKWSKKYANITGIDVGRKFTSNIPSLSEEMVIIFHVAQKTDKIPSSSKIPPYFSIAYNNKRIKVYTDVVKTGESKLQYIFPGQNIFQHNDPERHGTIGCIVIKGGQPHLLSNMHVIGWQYITKKGIIKDKPINGGAPPEIAVNDDGNIRPAAYFRSGGVDDRIDAAIALIPDNLLPYTNPLQHLFTMLNPIILPPTTMTKPLPVVMLGNVSGFKHTSIISTTAARTFDYPYGKQTLIYLLTLPYCSKEGDSGSAIYEPLTKRIIGIVIGANKEKTYTYAIPYFIIKNALEIY